MGTRNLTAEEVKKIAGLVKLTLDEKEVEKYQTTIPQTLDYIEVLDELDTKAVSPTSQVNNLKNVYRSDGAVSTISQEQALSNARETEKGLISTKGVFDRV